MLLRRLTNEPQAKAHLLTTGKSTHTLRAAVSQVRVPPSSRCATQELWKQPWERVCLTTQLATPGQLVPYSPRKSNGGVCCEGALESSHSYQQSSGNLGHGLICRGCWITMTSTKIICLPSPPASLLPPFLSLSFS